MLISQDHFQDIGMATDRVNNTDIDTDHDTDSDTDSDTGTHMDTDIDIRVATKVGFHNFAKYEILISRNSAKFCEIPTTIFTQ